MVQSIIDVAKSEIYNFHRTASQYRAYAVASDGYFMGLKEVICRDDREAIANAKRLVKDHDIGFGTATVS